LAFIIAAPLSGEYLSKIGRKRSIIIGLIVMVSATILFAVSPYFGNPYAFYAAATVGRMI
jgi:MFS family permease